MTKGNKTRAKLELAYHRIQLRRPTKIPAGTKLSILAVAREAAVSGTLIHTKYPDIAEKIRVQLGKSRDQKRDAKDSRIADCNSSFAAFARTSLIEMIGSRSSGMRTHASSWKTSGCVQ